MKNISAWLIVLWAFGLVSCKPRNNDSIRSDVSSERGGMVPTEERLERVRNQCIRNIDWSKKPTGIRAPLDYERNNFDKLTTGIVRAFYLIPTSADWLASWIRPSRYKVANQLKELVSELAQVKETIPKDQYREFRLACLAKCAASHIINYQDDVYSKVGNVDTIVARGVGVCTEFSRVANYFGERLGVSSMLVGNNEMAHAYNAFYISSEKRWYYAEPDNDSCTFMDLHFRNPIAAFRHEGTKMGAELIMGSSGKAAIELSDCRQKTCKLRKTSGDLRLVKSSGQRGSRKTLSKAEQYLRGNFAGSGYIELYPESCRLQITEGMVAPVRRVYKPRDTKKDCDGVRDIVNWYYSGDF